MSEWAVRIAAMTDEQLLDAYHITDAGGETLQTLVWRGTLASEIVHRWQRIQLEYAKLQAGK